MTKGERANGFASFDDGYTMIPNLLLEALIMAKLSEVQKSICYFIYRRTSGWKCVYDLISISEMAEACNANRSHVTRQLNNLIKKNIIRKKPQQSGKAAEYAIVTEIAAWDQNCIDLYALFGNADRGIYVNNTIRKQRSQAGARFHQLPAIGESEPYSYTKISNGVLTGCIYFCESLPYQLAELLQNKILEKKPDFKTPDLQKWAKQMDAILSIDQRSPEEVKEVILFAEGDSFQQNNILSVIKLRRQYDELNAKRLQGPIAPAPQNYRKAEPKVKKTSKFEPFYDA